MKNIQLHLIAALLLAGSTLGAQAPAPQDRPQSIATAKPTPVSESVRKALLAAREAIWRGEFLENPSLLPPETIGIVEWTEDWKHRDEIIAGAKTANANGINIKRLEFPRTEIQLYGDTAILYQPISMKRNSTARAPGWRQDAPPKSSFGATASGSTRDGTWIPERIWSRARS
jgi:hypothetical protein